MVKAGPKPAAPAPTKRAGELLDEIKKEFGGEAAKLVLEQGSKLNSEDGTLDYFEANSAYKALKAWKNAGKEGSLILASLRTYLTPKPVRESSKGISELRIGVGGPDEATAKGRMVKGHREGRWLIQYDDGRTVHAHYKRGVLHGSWTMDGKDGSESSAKYVDGKMQGTLRIEYWSDVPVPGGAQSYLPKILEGDVLTTQMSGDAPHGISCLKDGEGNIVVEAVFMRGQLIKSTVYDRATKEVVDAVFAFDESQQQNK